MAKVIVHKGEDGAPDITTALRKFKKQVINNGTLSDYRKHEYYMTPAEKRAFKRKEALKRKK